MCPALLCFCDTDATFIGFQSCCLCAAGLPMRHHAANRKTRGTLGGARAKKEHGTYSGAGPSVVMMGFRPSFLRFLVTAELPLAPAIIGGSPGGRVDDWAAGVVEDVLAGVDVSPAAFDVVGATGAVADAGGRAWAGFVPPFIMTARLGGLAKVNRRPESLFGCNRGAICGRVARLRLGLAQYALRSDTIGMRGSGEVCLGFPPASLPFVPSACCSFPLGSSGVVLAPCLCYGLLRRSVEQARQLLNLGMRAGMQVIRMDVWMQSWVPGTK